MSSTAYRNSNTPSSIATGVSGIVRNSNDEYASKDEFYQRLYDHRLKKVELQEEQFRIIRTGELGRRADIRASYNSYHHPPTLNGGVIAPAQIGSLANRLSTHDSQKRQQKLNLMITQDKENYLRNNLKQFTNKKSDQLARNQRRIALKDIYECLLYTVHISKEDEAVMKQQRQALYGKETLNVSDVSKVYAGRMRNWYKNSNKMESDSTEVDDNIDKDKKLFDSQTRLLDSVLARPDLLADIVTQQVIGHVLKQVQPKLIGLKEFVYLVENFMEKRKGPPINMVLGVPEKYHGDRKPLTSEEMLFKTFTGKPELLAKKTTQRLVEKKFNCENNEDPVLHRLEKCKLIIYMNL